MIFLFITTTLIVIYYIITYYYYYLLLLLLFYYYSIIITAAAAAAATIFIFVAFLVCYISKLVDSIHCCSAFVCVCVFGENLHKYYLLPKTLIAL